MGDIESGTGVDFCIFTSPWVQSHLAMGYQGILDALPKPSDDRFLGCRQHWPEAAFFLRNIGILHHTL
jgi:hypothetical protein